jgi:hypothetical protein
MEAAIGTYGLLVAHNLKLFPYLAEQPRTLQEVCDALKIVRRPADALLTLCVSAGLLRVQDGRYSLTSLAEDYLLEGSSTSFGGFLDLFIAIDSSGGLSVEAFKKAVLTNSPQISTSIPTSTMIGRRRRVVSSLRKFRKLGTWRSSRHSRDALRR